jgi:hypothetical protein
VILSLSYNRRNFANLPIFPLRSIFRGEIRPNQINNEQLSMNNEIKRGVKMPRFAPQTTTLFIDTCYLLIEPAALAAAEIKGAV